VKNLLGKAAAFLGGGCQNAFKHFRVLTEVYCDAVNLAHVEQVTHPKHKASTFCAFCAFCLKQLKNAASVNKGTTTKPSRPSQARDTGGKVTRETESANESPKRDAVSKKRPRPHGSR